MDAGQKAKLAKVKATPEKKVNMWALFDDDFPSLPGHADRGEW